MTGHKKRFCSFEKWTRITNITKTTVSVRNVALENTRPDVSAVKSALRRTPEVRLESVQMRMTVNMMQGLRKCDITTIPCAQNAKKTGNASGVESLCQPIVRVSARIAGLRTKRTMNAIRAIFRALSALCTAFATGVGRILSFRGESCARHATNRV